MKVCVIDTGYLFDAVLMRMPDVEIDEFGYASEKATRAGQPKNITSQSGYDDLVAYGKRVSLVTWVGVSVELRYLGRSRHVPGYPLPRPTFWKSWTEVRQMLGLRFEDVSMAEIEAGPLIEHGPVDAALLQLSLRMKTTGNEVELLTGDGPLRAFADALGISEARWPPEEID